MTTTKPEPGILWTVAKIAEHTDAPRHKIEYLIDARAIAPIARAGSARVFSADDVERIARELERIAERKGMGDES